jgi:tetratricopeptide (TPR) repeat protein
VARRGAASRWIPAAIVVLAIVVRFLHDAEMARTPFFRFPGLDASWHDEWARQIVSGDAPKDPFFRAPGYAYFVAAVYRMAGSGPWPIHAIQALLGGLTAWLVYRIGRRLFGRTAGLVASGMAAVYGPLVYFDGELLAPTLAIPVFLLALHLSLRARSALDWLVSGLAFGLGAIILPNILAVVLLLAAVMGVRSLARKEAGRLTRSAVPLLLGTFLLILPVIIRNGVVGGDWGVLASQGGVNFYAGNNEKATGVSVVLPQFARQPGWREFVSRTEAWATEQAGRPLKPSDVSRFYLEKGLKFWARSPGAALRLLCFKIYYLLNGHEIPNNRDLYSDRQHSHVLRILLWHAGPFHFPFGLVLPLAVLGLFVPVAARAGPPGRTGRSRRHEESGARGILVLYLAAYALSVVVFFVTERYRLPLVPILIVFAAGAGVNLARGWKPGPGALVVAILAALISNSHFGHAGQSNPAQETVRLASAWFDAGDYRRSAETFQAAARQDPRSSEALDGLGAVFVAAGEKAPALSAYEEAVRRGSRNAATWFNRATLLLETNHTSEAVESLEQAVALDPGYVSAWVNLGLARGTLGRTDAAMNALDRALALSPGNATALQERGRLLAAQGNMKEARATFEEALVASPGSQEVALNLALIDYEEGHFADAARRLESLLPQAPASLAPVLHFHLARIAARRGDRAAMIDHLEKARAAGFGPLDRALADPAFESYRGDADVLKLAR